MKQIILLRHARAIKDTWGQPDFERALTERGLEDAHRLSDYLHNHGIAPDKVLCSPALRTRQTCETLARELLNFPEITWLDDLYLASAGDMLQIINETENTSQTLLIVGHNPGLQHIALQLTHTSKPTDLMALQTKLPTCGMVQLAFPEAKNWQEITPNSGELLRFIYPKKLSPSAENAILEQ